MNPANPIKKDVEFCSQHPRIETSLKDIYDELKTKASNSTLKWGLGIFIAIFIAITSFFWNQTRMQENRLETNQKIIIDKIDSLKYKIDKLEVNHMEHERKRSR